MRGTMRSLFTAIGAVIVMVAGLLALVAFGLVLRPECIAEGSCMVVAGGFAFAWGVATMAGVRLIQAAAR
jgi:hypothetical protein